MALEKSKGTGATTTADLTVMDCSQRVWASTFYSLPSVLSTCGWTAPYLASNVGGGDFVVLLLFKEKSEAPRPSEHPPVRGAMLFCRV